MKLSLFKYCCGVVYYCFAEYKSFIKRLKVLSKNLPTWSKNVALTPYFTFGHQSQKPKWTLWLLCLLRYWFDKTLASENNIYLILLRKLTSQILNIQMYIYI